MTLSEYLSLFPGATREKPKFMALASAVLSQAADLAPVSMKALKNYSFLYAEGAALDALAATFGLNRLDTYDGPACTDTEFRKYLLAKLALWGWDGTNGTVQSILDAAGITKKQRDAMNGTVRITSGGTMPKASIPQVFPYPAGVSWLLVLEDGINIGHT